MQTAQRILGLDKIPVVVGVLGILLFLLLIPRASEAAERNLQISPPMAELVLTPGTTELTNITITNQSETLVSLEAFVRDFVAGDEGDQPRMLSEDKASSYSLKSWMLLSEKQFTLQPGEEKQIRVSIATPHDAEPGGRYGLVGFAEPNVIIGGGVGVKAGIATLLFATVAGDIIESATIAGFTGDQLNLTGSPTFSVTLMNTGNIHLVPSGTISITNLFGRQLEEIRLNTDERVILPNSERNFAANWQAGTAFGMYRAQATVQLSEGGQTLVSPSITIWVFPIRILAVGLLALILVILLLYEIEHHRALRLSRGESV